MTRAEEAALRAYPKGADEFHMCVGIETIRWIERRFGFQEGYEQAEKDFALTPDDVWCIFNLVRDLQTKYSATEGCLQEVADIFNSQRDKINEIIEHINKMGERQQ